MNWQYVTPMRVTAHEYEFGKTKKRLTIFRERRRVEEKNQCVNDVNDSEWPRETHQMHNPSEIKKRKMEKKHTSATATATCYMLQQQHPIIINSNQHNRTCCFSISFRNTMWISLLPLARSLWNLHICHFFLLLFSIQQQFSAIYSVVQSFLAIRPIF